MSKPMSRRTTGEDLGGPPNLRSLRQQQQQQQLKQSAPVVVDDDTKVQHPLQAILLADSFTKTFRPMSLERPKVLMPVANTPMMEFTLEMLANAKVKEIIVVCCWHADLVRAYIESSRWAKSRSPTVRIFDARTASSAGDALRELAATNTIQSDPFVLISGDVVSNVRLVPILKAHQARKERNIVMTMVFQRAPVGNRLRNLDDELVLVMDSETKRIVDYEVEEGNPDPETHEMEVIVGSDELFKEHSKLEVRYDLLDCHIDICSPLLLDLVTSNFYGDLRFDMLRNEVAQSVSLGNYFFAHEITSPTDYAARAATLRSYDQASRDVIRRWLYPLVPDNNWEGSSPTCCFSRGFLYREAGVVVDRGARIEGGVVLGADSHIGIGAIVSQSVLGRSCVVGDRAEIRGSYLWEGAIVHSGAKVIQAIICNQAVVGENAVIERGAVVSFGVHIPPNTVVRAFTRVTLADPFEDENASWGDANSEDGAGFEGVASAVAMERRVSGEESDKAASRSGSGSADSPRDVAARYRAYDPEEEEGFRSAPLWIRKAVRKLGLTDAPAEIVMSSMGADELEAELSNKSRSWLLRPGDEAAFEEEEAAAARAQQSGAGGAKQGPAVAMQTGNVNSPQQAGQGHGQGGASQLGQGLAQVGLQGQGQENLPRKGMPPPRASFEDLSRGRSSGNGNGGSQTQQFGGNSTSSSTPTSPTLAPQVAGFDATTLTENGVDILSRILDVGDGAPLREDLVDNVAFELRGLRAAQRDFSFAQLGALVTPALLVRALGELAPNASLIEVCGKMNKAFRQYAPLLRRFCFKIDGQNDVPVQTAVIDAVERACKYGPVVAAEAVLRGDQDAVTRYLNSRPINPISNLRLAFPFAIKYMYDEADIVGLEAINSWLAYRDSANLEDDVASTWLYPADPEVVKAMSKVREVLEDDEEEEEEEEEEEGDDEDDE